jgi:hypothetical protein
MHSPTNRRRRPRRTEAAIISKPRAAGYSALGVPPTRLARNRVVPSHSLRLILQEAVTPFLTMPPGERPGFATLKLVSRDL